MNQSKQMNTNLGIKAKGISNRINNEIANIFNQSSFVSTERKENSLISVKVVKGKNIYDFDLTHDYPFHPPKNIMINGNNYKQSLNNYSDTFKIVLKKNYGMECLCCNTILCGANWTPACNICHVINEIDTITKIKKEVVIRILCDKIRHKYHCYFAEFEKYLFE